MSIGENYKGIYNPHPVSHFEIFERHRFVPAMRPSGSEILPIDPIIESKATAHPAWPSFTTPRGKAIRYGPEACPRTIDIVNRFAAVGIDPRFTEQDTADIATAIKKVYPAIVNS